MVDLRAAFLRRVVRPLSPALHAHLLWQQGRREGLLELKVVDELVSPGEVAVDVGANIGLFARRFAHLVGHSGHVYLFEPLHRSCEHLLWRAFLPANTGIGLDQPGRYAAFILKPIHNFWV